MNIQAQRNFDRARRVHEAEMPPEDPEECDHSWRFLGSADGDNFYKCRKCGMDSES